MQKLYLRHASKINLEVINNESRLSKINLEAIKNKSRDYQK